MGCSVGIRSHRVVVERAHTRIGVGIQYMSADILSELVTELDLGKTNTESWTDSTLGSKGKKSWH